MSGLRQHTPAAALLIVHRTYHQEELSRTQTRMRAVVPARVRVCFLACFLVAAMAAAFSPADAQDFPADVTRGKAVYERHCLTCHGVNGAGDGPAAVALKVPPADFHRFKSYVKSDEELLRTIELGVVFSPMHSWQGLLTETERQDALAYIRLLVQEGR
jgi:mono/diheme cytochrome c family protein